MNDPLKNTQEQNLRTDIHIEWEGPLNIEEARALQSQEDYGLYQYYGEHPAYGSNALLYIGKAEDQTLGSRLSQNDWHIWSASVAEIYVGRICCAAPMSDAQWKEFIDLSERILLFSHSPSFNTKNLNNINYQGTGDVRVLNWGKRKKLLPEVSISRWAGYKFSIGHCTPPNLKRQQLASDQGE